MMVVYTAVLFQNCVVCVCSKLSAKCCYVARNQIALQVYVMNIQ